jgi:hypothetical protein
MSLAGDDNHGTTLLWNLQYDLYIDMLIIVASAQSFVLEQTSGNWPSSVWKTYRGPGLSFDQTPLGCRS